MKTRSISLLLLLALFWSATSFAQWMQVNNGLTTYRFRIYDPVVVVSGIGCANVYKSASILDSIKACEPSGSTGMLGLAPSNGFCAVAYDDHISGWTVTTDLTHPLPSVISLAVSPASGAGTGSTTLFAGTSRNAFRSTDNGTSWTQMNSDWIIPYTDYWTVRAFFVRGTNIYASNGYAPFLSTDNGASWQQLAQIPAQMLLVDASRTCLFATTMNGRILRSTNNGAGWDTITIPGALAIIDTNLFAQHTNGQIDLSTDNGTSWTMVFSGSSFCDSTDHFCSSGKYLFYMKNGNGTSNNVIRKMWTDSTLIYAPDMNFPPGYLPNSTSGKVYSSGESVLLDYGGIFFSTNSGADWQVLSLPSGVSSSGPFVNSGTNFFVGGTGVWRMPVSSPLPIRLASFKAAICGNNGVSLTWTTLSETNTYGFYIQRDGADIAFVAGHGTTLQPHTYAYTDNPAPGERQYRLRQVDMNGSVTFSESVTAGVSAPQKFTLAQNYPNPFNPSTTIRYALPVRSHVALSVYNTLGEDVIDLVNGDVEAGYHEATFDGSRMASGVYFYRIEAGRFVETKKLILIR